VRGQRHAPAALPPGKEPVPIVQEAGWAPGPVWTGAENLAPHGDSIPGPSSDSIILQVNGLQFLLETILRDQNLKNLFIAVLQAAYLRQSY